MRILYMPRCPNGTRKNKAGDCIKKVNQKSSPTRKSPKTMDYIFQFDEGTFSVMHGSTLTSRVVIMSDAEVDLKLLDEFINKIQSNTSKYAAVYIHDTWFSIKSNVFGYGIHAETINFDTKITINSEQRVQIVNALTNLKTWKEKLDEYDGDEDDE